MVWHGDTEVPDVDLIVVPAAFPTVIICVAAHGGQSGSCAM
jgi:hypothetical protein